MGLSELLETLVRILCYELHAPHAPRCMLPAIKTINFDNLLVNSFLELQPLHQSYNLLVRWSINALTTEEASL